MKLLQKATRAVLILGMLGLLGCASNYKAYKGPKLPASKIAVVNGVFNILPLTVRLSISSVDGKKLDPYEGSVEVLPGIHKIGVEYYFNGNGGVVANGKVTVDAKAGKTYQLGSTSVGNLVRFSIKEADAK